jgi:hypothetical protein
MKPQCNVTVEKTSFQRCVRTNAVQYWGWEKWPPQCKKCVISTSHWSNRRNPACSIKFLRTNHTWHSALSIGSQGTCWLHHQTQIFCTMYPIRGCTSILGCHEKRPRLDWCVDLWLDVTWCCRNLAPYERWKAKYQFDYRLHYGLYVVESTARYINLQIASTIFFSYHLQSWVLSGGGRGGCSVLHTAKVRMVHNFYEAWFDTVCFSELLKLFKWLHHCSQVRF